MAAPSNVNPLFAGSLSIVDAQRKPYAGGWIGMADDLDGGGKWLRVGGIDDGGTRLALDAQSTFVKGNLGIGAAPTDKRLSVSGDAQVGDAATGRLRVGMLGLDWTNGNWGSLTYNAEHTPGAWTFFDPAKPAVTVEMDSAGGPSRFEVYTTTQAAPGAWNLRLSVAGDTGTVTVPGRLNAGTQNIFGVAAETRVQRNAGVDAPGNWSTQFHSGRFSEIYTAFAVFQGFSIWSPHTTPAAFRQTGQHWDNDDAIVQNAWVAVDGSDVNTVWGQAYCSESHAGNEADNQILFTVVVLGKPV